jgi:cytochrome P450
MTEAAAPAAPSSADVARAMLTFDPTTPEYRANPHAAYRQARELGGVVRSQLGLWVVTHYDLCASVLRDAAFGWGDSAPDEDTTTTTRFTTNPDGTQVRPFIFLDPPDHTRLRKLVNKAFTPARVRTLLEQTESLVADLLAKARAEAGDGPIDLMSTIARPVPALVLGTLLGVADEDVPRFQSLCADIGRGLDLAVFLTPEQIARRDSGRQELITYFGELAEKRRVEPRADLVSELVLVEEAGDKLTMAELCVTCTLLLSAGYVTTENLIGNGMLALLRNPEQLDWLRANPDRLDDAIEELLRYDGPTQLVGRVALEDTELGGQPIAKGETVLLMLGAANHDPAAFENADELDLSRSGRNLGFGGGIHYCIGAPLARMVTKVVVGELVRHDLRLVPDAVRAGESITIRGVAELPVTVRDR